MKKIFTIYYCGNPLVEKDSLPFRLVPELKQLFPDIAFIHHDPSENLKPDHGRFVAIDTVINTDRVLAITDPAQISGNTAYSAHDWDLGLNLRLLCRLGEIKEFLIIGVPPTGDRKKIIAEVTAIIKKYFRENVNYLKP